jgi:hypothetical protein
LSEAEQCTEEADQAGLAEDAVIKLEGIQGEQARPNHFRVLGNFGESKGKSN